MKSYIRVLWRMVLVFIFLIMILIPLFQLVVALNIFALREVFLWHSNVIGFLVCGAFGLSSINIPQYQNGEEIFVRSLLFFGGIFCGVSVFGVFGMHPPGLLMVVLWLNVIIAFSISIAGYFSLVQVWKSNFVIDKS